MSKTMSAILCIIVAAGSVAVTSAELDYIEAKLSQSECIYFEFVSTLQSNIFNTIDTSFGTAYIARNGPYLIEIGPDVYLYDGEFLYSYFWENNQVIIERADTSRQVADEISFVMKLSEWYDSRALDNARHLLRKKEGIEGDIPDSMIVFINAEDSTIRQIEYYDINDDLNRIHFNRQLPDSTCDGKRFQPDFPDSVEQVRL